MQDAFPFYDWNLFSFTPRIEKVYFVRVHKLDGKKLDPPDLVLFKRDVYPGHYKKALPLQIMRLGGYLENPVENHDRIEEYRHVLERNLFTEHHSAEYEMDYAILDIREALHKKEIKDFTKLSQFEFNRNEIRR